MHSFEHQPFSLIRIQLVRTNSKAYWKFARLFAGRVVNRFSKDISSIDEQLLDVTYNFFDVRSKQPHSIENNDVSSLFRRFSSILPQR